MKRALVLTLASMLALSMASHVLAGPAGTQGPKKQNISGTIEKINAKQRLLVVKENIGQQIQTQSVAQQDGKVKKARTVSLVVDDKTEIVVKTPATQEAKGAQPSQQPVNSFGLLQAGQTVRVVYVMEEQAAAQPQQQAEPVGKKKKPQPVQAQQQPVQQQQPAQLQPAQQPVKGKDKPQQTAQQQQAEPAQPAGQKGAPAVVAVKAKKVARAVRIEVLTQSSAQQSPVPPQPAQQAPATPAQAQPAQQTPAAPAPPQAPTPAVAK